MSDLIKTINRQKQDLSQLIPEKADLQVLEHYADIAMLRGMKKMTDIIDTDEYETDQGNKITIYPADKIKAFNAILSLGKLVDSRKDRAESLKDNSMQIPDDLRM